MAVYRTGIGGFAEDVAASAGFGPSSGGTISDPCGQVEALRAKGITSSSTIPAFAAMAKQLEGLCAQQRAASAPTLGKRKLTSLTPRTSTAPYDPCAAAQKARAIGQSAAIISALDAKCRTWKLSGGYEAGSARGVGGSAPTPIAAGEPERTGYPEPPPEPSVSPALIAGGIAAVLAIGFVAYKKLA